LPIFVYNVVLALHIDTTALSDGTYELIPESDGGDLEAQVNTAELTEAPNQSSEEPRAEIVSNLSIASCFVLAILLENLLYLSWL